MYRNLLTVALAALSGVVFTVAADDDVTVIVEHFTSGNNNTVVQPDELYRRLLPVKEEESVKDAPSEPLVTGTHASAGFRVQVFSDNNTRTAKNEARSKARMISARFPQYATYVRYTSPYWRLKVGDFRTQQDANEAAEALRKAFPAFSKEIRVVRDRVNLSE